MDLGQFHFLRPWALSLLFLAVLILYWQPKNLFKRSAWSKVVDEHLLKHLTKAKNEWRNYYLPIFIACLSLAMAGPSWQKLPQNQDQVLKPLIILLDMSEHMLSSDLSPSRLKRALYKLEDFFAAQKGREMAIISFAGDAHVLSPLSLDHKTLLSLSKYLEPSIMPVPGANLEKALIEADKMAKESELLLITSTNLDDSPSSIKSILEKNSRKLIIWTFATKAGAPLLDKNGRFAQNSQTQIKLSTLQKSWLEKMEESSLVRVVPLSSDGQDIEKIGSMLPLTSIQASKTIFGAYDEWQDMGPYFLLLALIVFLLASFVKGSQWLSLCFLLIIFPKEVKAFGLKDFFLRDAQIAHQALLENNFEKAASLYEDSFAKGTALFKAQKYEEAAKFLAKAPGAEAKYNLGNSLAHLNKVEEAIEAYDEALKLDPTHEDAKHNKEVLEKLKAEQEKQSQENQQKNDEKNNDEKKEGEQKSSDEKNKQEQSQENNKKGENKNEDSNNEQKSESSKDSKKRGEEEQKKTETKKLEKAEEEGQGQKQIQKAESSPEERPKLDPKTQYIFDQLEQPQNQNLYLKQKFRYESEKQARER